MGKWLKRILILLVLLLVAGWFGVPWLLGTSWARDKVKAALEKNTNREVEVGSIAFGWFSGLQVHDVTVKQKPSDHQADGPLFQLGSLNLEVGLGDILKKTIRVDEFTVEAPRIVIVRDATGRFNFADLLGKPAEAPSPEPGGEPSPAPGGGESEGRGSGTKVVARMDIENGTILYIDVPYGTRIEASGIRAQGTWEDGKLALDMSCALNGGDVRLRTTTDLSAKPSPLTVDEFAIEGARFDSNLAQLGLFLPLAGDSPRSASGTIAFKLENLETTGLDLEDVKRSLTGTGSLSLEGGTLLSGPVTQLFNALQTIGAGDLSALGAAVGEASDSRQLGIELLTSTFAIRDGKIHTDDMKLDGAGIDLTLSGWTSLDGRIDYQMVASGLSDLLEKNEKVREILGDRKTIPFGFTGTLGSPKISADLEGLVEGAIRNRIDKEIKDRIPGGIKLPIPGGK